MQIHRFVREDSGWFIDLPDYISHGGSIADLQMIDGADTMLDLVAGNERDVTLKIDRESFEGSDELVLTELCDPILGGGYYHINNFENKPVNRDLWLCEVTKFVFGDIPERIYVKRV